MEPVGPAYNPTENDVAPTPPIVPVAPTYNQIEDRVTPGDQAVRRSTRVPKPSTRYPARVRHLLGETGKEGVAKGDSEYVHLVVVFIIDNIHIIEIEFVLISLGLLTRN